jgi:hypothetical protein
MKMLEKGVCVIGGVPLVSYRYQHQTHQVIIRPESTASTIVVCVTTLQEAPAQLSHKGPKAKLRQTDRIIAGPLIGDRYYSIIYLRAVLKYMIGRRTNQS